MLYACLLKNIALTFKSLIIFWIYDQIKLMVWWSSLVSEISVRRHPLKSEKSTSEFFHHISSIFSCQPSQRRKVLLLELSLFRLPSLTRVACVCEHDLDRLMTASRFPSTDRDGIFPSTVLLCLVGAPNARWPAK